jgi:hypothetical protein
VQLAATGNEPDIEDSTKTIVKGVMGRLYEAKGDACDLRETKQQIQSLKCFNMALRWYSDSPIDRSRVHKRMAYVYLHTRDFDSVSLEMERVVETTKSNVDLTAFNKMREEVGRRYLGKAISIIVKNKSSSKHDFVVKALLERALEVTPLDNKLTGIIHFAQASARQKYLKTSCKL